jgi:hypothetical protein
VDSCGRPPSGSGRSDGRLERLAAFDVRVDPLFRPFTPWHLPLSYFLRRRGPVVLVCKPSTDEHVWSEPEPLSPYRPASSFTENSSLSALSYAEIARVLVSLSSLIFQPLRTTLEARSVWSGAPSASPFPFGHARALTVFTYVVFQYVLISNFLRSALIERSAIRQARFAVI